MKKIKPKTMVTAIATLAVFALTYFAMAENKSANSVFLDSDQDGLTDQEEKAIGTSPSNSDTDGDGYSDGREMQSGYNPLKSAPGDKVFAGVDAESISSSGSPAKASSESTTDSASQTGSSGTDLFSGSETDLASLVQGQVLTNDVFSNFSSDPQNPNLTNEMIGQLMQMTKDKTAASEDFANNPTFSDSDLGLVTQGSLETVDIAKDLPEIKDDELKILPEINGDDLKPEEIKDKQKQQIEKYLASLAYVFANNSPFPVDTPEKFNADVKSEGSSLIKALASGNTEKIDLYAEKAQTGIDQVKKIEVPFVMKDLHKSVLQLAIYTVGLKDSVAVNPEDPMKSLAALSSLQAVTESGMKIMGEMQSALTQYGITSIEFP